MMRSEVRIFQIMIQSSFLSHKNPYIGFVSTINSKKVIVKEMVFPLFDFNSAILLVDDEADIVAVFEQQLNKQGFQATGFTNPQLALEHLQKYANQYGLVISDLKMPEMNGYEFVKKVKEIKPEIKVFIITAFDINKSEFGRVLPSIRIDEFIQKPISGKNLISIIERHAINRLGKKSDRKGVIITQ